MPRVRPVEPGAVDLTSRDFGASVMAAGDDSLGAKEHLLTPGDPVGPDRPGAGFDVWRTRRRTGAAAEEPTAEPTAEPADWALVRLRAPGVVSRLLVDTTGCGTDHPEAAEVLGLRADGHPRAADLVGRSGWRPLLSRSPLGPETRHEFLVRDTRSVTHLLLRIFPDGAVARLRAHGRLVPSLADHAGLGVDLLSAELGATVVAGSDDARPGPLNLLLPGPARSRAEGWQARRLRSADPGRHDWLVFALAAAGAPALLEVDTRWFTGDASDAIDLWAHPGPLPTDSDGAQPPPVGEDGWVRLLPRTPLVPDAPHRWRLPPSDHEPFRYVLLRAYPDGGLSRVRLHGRLADD